MFETENKSNEDKGIKDPSCWNPVGSFARIRPSESRSNPSCISDLCAVFRSNFSKEDDSIFAVSKEEGREEGFFFFIFLFVMGGWGSLLKEKLHHMDI